MGVYEQKVNALFTGLKSDLEAYLPEESIEQVDEALQLAAEAHKGQKRRSGEHYITHPVAVARILASLHMDVESIIAAILHDVIEDTAIDKNTLREKFGREVADLVDGVSKLTQIQFKSRAEAQAENFRKMVLSMARDIRVIIVKLADRLHNMRTLDPLDVQKRRRIARETLEIYAPIANRLGMNSFRVEFEDRSFAALSPMRSRILKAAVRKARGNRREHLNSIQRAIEKCLEDDHIEGQVFGREKHLYGIYTKMRYKQLPFAEVTDVFAFRIIVDSVDTCYRVLGSIHNLYKPVPGRFKDYIAIPKANSYQSLHTVLFGPFGSPIEVQIRTHDMQRTAETGIAAHWLYKSGEEISQRKAHAKASGWVRDLLELQQNAGTPLEFIENVKTDLFPDEVYVFTPKGKIFELKGGATAVDFAYAVHTDVGNSCIAAKIDRQLAPLSTRLQTGQTIEVITAPGARPNPAWLNFVVTGKARSNIRHFLKNQQRSESISLGRRLLEQALEGHALALDALSDDTLSDAFERFNVKDLEHLLEEVGLGNRSALLIARHFSTTLSETPTEIESASGPLVIKGTEGMVVSYAKCCHPLPGDPILGFLSAGRGIVIHTASCPNTVAFRNKPDKQITVEWENVVQGEFDVELMVHMENRRGALAQLAIAISEMNSNIDKISTHEKDGTNSLCSIIISVKDRIHLATILRHIRKVPAVLKVARVK